MAAPVYKSSFSGRIGTHEEKYKKYLAERESIGQIGGVLRVDLNGAGGKWVRGKSTG
jgi:hypothetical protein